MNINPIWYICLLVRSTLAYIIYDYHNEFNKYLIPLLFIISSGFFYKGYTGSNNETQLAKVFWHDSRYIHGILYLLAVYYLCNSNYKMSSILVALDIVFSILYRFIMNR